MESGILEQEWAHRRFAGLRPINIGTSLRIVSLAGLTPPPGFETVWRVIPAESTIANFTSLLSEDIPALEAILLLCHPYQQTELFRVCQLVMEMQDAFGDRTPPFFWLHHTVAPEKRPMDFSRDSAVKDITKAAMEAGLDSVMATEPSGFRLALEIRMVIRKTIHAAGTMSSYLDRLAHMRRQRARLRSFVDSTLWEYLVARLGGNAIPPLDRTLPAGMPHEVGGWTVGRYVGRGSFGMVHLLMKPPTPDHPEGTWGVIKALAKCQMKTLTDVRLLRRTIEIMQELSSAQWQHPGIVRLFEVYHSATHILLCMEYGGSQNLFSRLRRRDNPTGEHCGLSVTVVRAIISQIVAAVAHMHTRPQICHRDLKPENFIVSEEAGNPYMRVKLTDFDLAASLRKPCKTPCGSLPFVAPEVILEREYLGAPADVWSLAVVLLEVICRTRILETAFQLDITDQGQGNKEAVAEDIARIFSVEGTSADLLEEHLRPELADLGPKAGPVLKQTLRVDPANRWPAERLREAAEDL